ncbi:TPA: hypothetical protein GF625_09230 [Escherichia coli]|nr:hypothetical protein [Escherichia coli]HAH2662190.1 hypothetical protein [Escherichia coli]
MTTYFMKHRKKLLFTAMTQGVKNNNLYETHPNGSIVNSPITGIPPAFYGCFRSDTINTRMSGLFTTSRTHPKCTSWCTDRIARSRADGYDLIRNINPVRIRRA